MKGEYDRHSPCDGLTARMTTGHLREETGSKCVVDLEARMQQEVTHELGRIVPTEMLEIEKGDRAVQGAARIVKAEIRRAQGRGLFTQNRITGFTLQRHEVLRAFDHRFHGGLELHLEELSKASMDGRNRGVGGKTQTTEALA